MASPMLLLLAGAAVAMLALAVVMIVRIRRGKAGPATVLRVTRFLAIAYAGLAVLGTLFGVFQSLLTETVQLSMPVREFWPELRPTVEILDGPTASVLYGGFQRAEVAVSGLDLPARLLLAGGHLLQGVTMTIIAVAVAVLCTRLLAGSPFRPVLSRSVMVAAVAVAAGGILWQLCFQLAGVLASAQVLTVTAWTADEAVMADPGTDIGWPEPSFGFTLEFWPLMLGLALAALAAAFRHGERLQRDTEGLV
jgi:hypothetical protein